MAEGRRALYPKWTEQTTGVPADLIREAARRYATSGASLCVHGLGMTEHRWGSHGVMALVDLALATGNIGRPGTGINPLRGQNNVQGARRTWAACRCILPAINRWTM